MTKQTLYYISQNEKAVVGDIYQKHIDVFVSRAKREREHKFSGDTSKENVLRQLLLLNHKGLLNAALMLFAKDPQRFCPAAVVKCSHYHGSELTRPIPNHQVFGGTLFEQIDSAVNFVLSIINRTVGGRHSSPAADIHLEIPNEAITEIIVNAVVHRNYNSKGSVQVTVFSDRVEVMNPGGLPEELTIADLKGKHLSIPVNPFLARPFYLAAYINQLGYGTQNVMKWCREAQLPEPTFEQSGQKFSVTIWRDWVTEEWQRTFDLNDRQIKAIAFIKKYGRISNPEYQQLASTTKKTATRDLANLRDKGVVEQRGTFGPGVHYVMAYKRGHNGDKGDI